MEISPLLLLQLLFFSFLWGAIIGLLNDINRLVRVFFGIKYTKINYDKIYSKLKFKQIGASGKKILKFIIVAQDLILLLILTYGIIILNYYFNDGRIRWFSVLAFIIGFILYYFVIGKMIMTISEPIVLIIHFLILTVFKIFLMPFIVLLKFIKCSVEKIYNVLRKRIEKKKNISYNKKRKEYLLEKSKQGFVLFIE